MMLNKGFTLIEVLVAVVILAGGLLGLAALQASSLSNNYSAYNRSQAVQLAYDIADRMRANPTAAANYAAVPPYNCPKGGTAESCPACTSAANVCTPIELAQKDLFEWNNNIIAVLPVNGSGIITAGANGVYTVTISWSDDKKNLGDNVSFVMTFRL